MVNVKEQRIGTWIDNKPLYQSIIQGEITASSDGESFGVTDIDISSYNFETIVSFKANANAYEGGTHYDATMLHLTHWPANLITCFILEQSPQILRLRTTATDFIDVPVYVTVLYTKTTDTI